jgi:hypothetical protein
MVSKRRIFMAVTLNAASGALLDSVCQTCVAKMVVKSTLVLDENAPTTVVLHPIQDQGELSFEIRAPR